MGRPLLLVSLLLATFAGLNAQILQPPAPTNLIATLDQSRLTPKVILKWQAPVGTWWFKVYRADDVSRKFRFLNVTTVPRYEDFVVYPGHTYYYFVTGFLSRDSTTTAESRPSNVDSVSLPQVVRPVGTIAGTVTDSISGRPIRNVKVSFYRRTSISNWLPHAVTDSLGEYTALVDTGTYIVHAAPFLTSANLPQWTPEWYKDARTPDGARPVPVRERTRTIVDFDLVVLPPPTVATIRGHVFDTAGAPLDNAFVAITRTVQDLTLQSARGSGTSLDDRSATIEGVGFVRGIVWSGYTDAGGKYAARVPAGAKYLAMAAKKGYLPEFYMEKSNPADADIIRVTRDTSGIDFSLAPLPAITNSISGMVRDSNQTGILSRILLIPRRPILTPLSVRFGLTDSSGLYALTNIRGGTYYVLAIPFSEYAPAFYKKDWYGVFHWRKADPVQVDGQVTGIDIGVVPIRSFGPVRLAGRILGSGVPGKIMDPSGLAGAHVQAQDATGEVVGYGMTDETGQYSIENVPSGDLNVSADKEGYDEYETTVSVGAGEYAAQPPDATLQATVFTSVGESGGTPERFGLEQNYPNPFNPGTTIQFALPAAGPVTLKVFNLLGQQVATILDEVRPAGHHEISFDAGQLPSGVYMYRLQSGTGSATRRLVVLR